MKHSSGIHVVTASARIAAAPERVYAIIADYKNGHPRILPKQFLGLAVEQGGVGAGTIINFQMRAFGRIVTNRSAVTEPEPGRVLVETELGGQGIVTTFTVIPGPQPSQADVTISTAIPVRRSGALGRIERILTTLYLSPIYRRELELLAARAAEA